MEEQKEFTIINQQKYDSIQNKGNIIIKAIRALSAFAIGTTACIDYLLVTMIMSGVLPNTSEKLLYVLTFLINSFLGITMAKVICDTNKIRDALNDIKRSYENAEDKDNIEISTDSYNLLLKQ